MLGCAETSTSGSCKFALRDAQKSRRHRACPGCSLCVGHAALSERGETKMLQARLTGNGRLQMQPKAQPGSSFRPNGKPQGLCFLSSKSPGSQATTHTRRFADRRKLERCHGHRCISLASSFSLQGCRPALPPRLASNAG